MRAPRSLRGRIALAAVGAVALCGALAGGLLLAAVERDGRNQLDGELRERVDQILSRARVGGYGRRGGGAEPLLRGSGSFAQIAYGNEVTEQAGDVPDTPRRRARPTTASRRSTSPGRRGARCRSRSRSPAARGSRC